MTTTCALKNVYTVEEFAAEILCGKRHPNWVRNNIKAKKIKVVATAPYLIPQSEAMRFIDPSSKTSTFPRNGAQG